MLMADAEAEKKTTSVAAAATAGNGGRDQLEEAAEEGDVDELIQELLEIISSVSAFGEYRRTHRKESFNLVRRVKLVAPLLEEIREHEVPIPEAAHARLRGLLKAFTAARKLLRCCHDGSKIYLVHLTPLFPIFRP